jgi:hypothetical protein
VRFSSLRCGAHACSIKLKIGEEHKSTNPTPSFSEKFWQRATGVFDLTGSNFAPFHIARLPEYPRAGLGAGNHQGLVTMWVSAGATFLFKATVCLSTCKVVCNPYLLIYVVLYAQVGLRRPRNPKIDLCRLLW